jgi:hypothetical protein
MEEERIRNLFSDIIKKQIVILGPGIALMKARNVPGLTVDDEGNVSKIDGEPKTLLDKLVSEYVSLSGLIVKKTLEPLLEKYEKGEI